MEALGRDAARDLVLLSLTAGSADAVGFLSLGHVFTSNMTGNVVLMGINLGQGHFELAARGLYVLAVFVGGLSLGTWLGRDLPEKQWPSLAFRLIGLEKILLLLFGIVWFLTANNRLESISYGLLSLLALAMGLQSAALNRLSAPGVVTTAITGTITALTIGVVTHLLTKANPTDQVANLKRERFQLSIITLYIAGAALSGLLILHGSTWAGFIPICAAAFVSFGNARK